MAIGLPHRTVWCCLACVLALGGCRPGNEQLAPVNGRVLYRGQPLQGGVASLFPTRRAAPTAT